MSEVFGNIESAGVDEWQLRGSGAERYYPILAFRDVDLLWQSNEVGDQFARNRATIVSVLLKGKIMITNLDHIQKLVVPAERLNHRLKLRNGNYFSTELLTGGATEGYFGWLGSFVTEADADGNRYIGFEAARKMLKSEFDVCFGVPPAVGTPNVADTYYFLSQAVDTDIKPEGLADVLIKPSGGAYESLRVFSGGKLTASGVPFPKPDNMGRRFARNIKLEIELERWQSTDTEIAALETHADRLNDWKPVLIDGLEIEMLQSLGLGWKMMNKGEGDENQGITYRGTGIIHSSNWPGMLSGIS